MTSKRTLITSALAAVLVLAPATTALAWTNSSAISCTTSTGWQIHIKASTSGYRYDTVVKNGVATTFILGNGGGTVTNKTGKSLADKVSVSAGSVSSASRYCGTV